MYVSLKLMYVIKEQGALSWELPLVMETTAALICIAGTEEAVWPSLSRGKDGCAEVPAPLDVNTGTESSPA
jgi:hypothetical protein